MTDRTKFNRLLELMRLMEKQERLLQSEILIPKPEKPEDLFYEDLEQINPYYARYRYSEITYE